MSKITDIITPSEMVEKNWRTQNDLRNFWAHCVDLVRWHENHVKMEPGETLPLFNQFMCVAYCAATWGKWQEDYAYRRTLNMYNEKMEECIREIAALKKERAQLRAKLRKAKEQKEKAR